MFDGAHTSIRGSRVSLVSRTAARMAVATNLVLPHPGGPCTSCNDPRSGTLGPDGMWGNSSARRRGSRIGSQVLGAMNLAPARSCDAFRSISPSLNNAVNRAVMGSSSGTRGSLSSGASSSESDSEKNLTCDAALAPMSKGMKGTLGATCAAATILCWVMTVSSTSTLVTFPSNPRGLLPPIHNPTGALFKVLPIDESRVPLAPPLASKAASMRTLAPVTMASMGCLWVSSRITNTVPGLRQSSFRFLPKKPRASPSDASMATQLCNPAPRFLSPPAPASFSITDIDLLRDPFAKDLASVALASSKAIASCTA